MTQHTVEWKHVPLWQSGNKSWSDETSLRILSVRLAFIHQLNRVRLVLYLSLPSKFILQIRTDTVKIWQYSIKHTQYSLLSLWRSFTIFEKMPCFKKFVIASVWCTFTTGAAINCSVPGNPWKKRMTCWQPFSFLDH